MLNAIQIKPVLIRNKVNCKTQMTKPTRPANAMEICLGILGEIEVDDDVDGLDIDTASEEVRADKIATNAIAEVVEDAITM